MPQDNGTAGGTEIPMVFQTAHMASYETHSTRLHRVGTFDLFVTADKYGEVALSATSRGLTSRVTFDAEAARLVAAELIKAADAMEAALLTMNAGVEVA